MGIATAILGDPIFLLISVAILAGAAAVKVDLILGLEEGSQVRENPEPYGNFDPEARRIMREVEKFLAVADKAKKVHLIRQLRWLREAEEAKKRQKGGQ